MCLHAVHSCVAAGPVPPCLSALLSQVAQPWERSRLHVLVRPHALLLAAAANGVAASFAFSPAASQLAFLQDYQLSGRSCLPLGTLLEMSAAAALACLGDGSKPRQHLVLAGAAAPSLIELPEEAATAPLVVCTLLPRIGQLVVAGCGPTGQQHCLSAQLARVENEGPNSLLIAHQSAVKVS